MLNLLTAYNLPLVTLSIVIAVLAAYTALDMASRVTATQGGVRLTWLLGGAIAMGIGIWSMHFIGMLAVCLPFDVRYDFLDVFLSALPAIAASGLALLVVSRSALRWRDLVGSSLLMGGGIATMHYSGMAAMQMPAVIEYNLPMVWLSVLVAVVVSGVGLFLIFSLREEETHHIWKKLAAAIVIGMAIPTMHYIGMAAADFIPVETPSDPLSASSHGEALAIAVIVGTLIVFGISWTSTFLSRLKESEAKFKALAKQEELVNQLSTKIRESLEVAKILQTTVEEVRLFVSTDRALIYQFDADWRGRVTFEDVASPWLPTLGKAADDCFPAEYLEYYRQGGIRRNNNVLQANFSPDHVEFLQQLQIQANVIVPIMVKNQLWGLLIVHQCSHPREWQIEESKFLNQLAVQLGIAIQQATLHAQVAKNALKAQIQAQHLRRSEKLKKQQNLALQKNIKELQSLQVQLIQSEKMSSLGQLVAGVAHEINNPVNFIHGNLTHVRNYADDLLALVHLYQQHYPNPVEAVQLELDSIEPDFLQEDLAKVLTSMKVGSDRIREIVLSLRNFSRLDEASLKTANIHEGIDSTLMILQYKLKARPNMPAIEVVREYDYLPPVSCYPGQLNQVFMNILVNAIDALESMRCQPSLQDGNGNLGQITIRTSVIQEDWVEIAIADNGSGIPEAARARIFDPFFTTKPIGKGTGMGMSISYKIVVEGHGGKLDYVSDLRQGTEFFIRIPIQQPKDSSSEDR